MRFPWTKPANSFSNGSYTQTTAAAQWRLVEPLSTVVEAERLAVAVAHMPAPSAIPGNLAQVMHMIHWTLPRPRFKILFVLAAPCPKPVCPERDRRKAPSSALSVNELAAFDRDPTHKTAAMPLEELCIFGYHTVSIPPQLDPHATGFSLALPLPGSMHYYSRAVESG